MDPVNPGYEQPAIQQPITTEPIGFGIYPQPVQCSACGQKAVTSTHYEVGTATWVAALVICPFCPAGCCLVPFITDYFKDVEHTCPVCNAVLGRHTKI
eukprot:gene3507-1894_t